MKKNCPVQIDKSEPVLLCITEVKMPEKYDTDKFFSEEAAEIYRLPEWIPREITEADEFLPEELKEIHQYMKEHHVENIAAALHVFEERVLFDSELSEELEKILRGETAGKQIHKGAGIRKPLAWETIRIYPHETEKDGKYIVKEFHADKRKVKQYFLRGWMEVGLWDRGEHRERKIYLPPEKPERLGLSSGKKGQFFYGEDVRFSLEVMRNFQEKYLALKSAQRDLRPRFVNLTHSVTGGTAWQVFVTSELRNYYYDEGETVQNEHSAEFTPVCGKMHTLNCLKKNETGHAVIANYDSWQAFIHACMTKEKIMRNIPISVQMRRLREAAVKDTAPVPGEIREILKQIAAGAKIGDLSQEEQNRLSQTSEISSKIRLMSRLAKLRYIRTKTAEHLAAQTAPRVIQTVRDRLIKWMSPVWEPQWAGVHAGAGDIPEQKHRFRMKDGEIEISCLWKSAYKKTPAYIQITWAATISTDAELWLCFVSSETGDFLSEVCLGTHLEGGKILTEKTLGFDPSKEKWAVSVFLKEKQI